MGWVTDYLEKLSLIDYAASKMNPAQKTLSISLEALQPEIARSLLRRAKGASQRSRGKIRAGKGAAGKDVRRTGAPACDAEEVGG